MKLLTPNQNTILKAIIAFLTPPIIAFALSKPEFMAFKIHSYLFHSLVMLISGLLSFYAFYDAYKNYKLSRNPILFSVSAAFLSFGTALLFHTIAVPGVTHFLNEIIFDISEHYGFFIGSLILLGIVFPYNKKTEEFLYIHHRLFLYGLVLLFLVFFAATISQSSLTDFLESHIDLPISATGIALFLNACFILGMRDAEKKRDSFITYLTASLFVLSSIGIIPFFYEEWGILWWFFHLIFIIGFLLILIGLLKTDFSSGFGSIFSHIPISARIIMNYFALSVLGIFTLSYLSYYSARSGISNQLFNDLSLISKVERENILNFFEYAKGRAIDFSSDGFIRDSAGQIIGDKNTADKTVGELNIHLIKNKMSLDKNIVGINILDLNGKIIASTDKEEINKNEMIDDYFIGAKNLQYGVAYMSDVKLSRHFNTNASFAASTILTNKETHEPIGVIVNYYDALVINEIINGRYGKKVTDWAGTDQNTKKTMEIFAANSDGLMITESKFIKNAVLRQKAMTEAHQQCQSGKEQFQGIYSDYRGVSVVGAAECLPNNWLLVTKIDFEEAFAPLKIIQMELLIFGVIVLIFVLTIAFFLSKAITLPLKKLEIAAIKVSDGDLSTRAEIISADEIGHLAKIFNKMIGQLQQLYQNLEQKVKERTKELAERIKEIGREKEKLSTILFGIGDGVFVIDNDFKIILWNKVAEEISGFSAQDALDKKYDEIMKFTNEKTGEITSAFVKTAMATGQIQQMSNHTLLTRKNGSQIAVADSCAPLKDIGGNVIGCVVIFRDATKEREVDRMKTEFVSVASHQLRSPLTAIKLSLEMLADNNTGRMNTDQKNYLNNIQQSTQSMTALVNDLLNISRLETGKIQINPKPVDLKELINKILDDFNVISAAHNCKISFRATSKLTSKINTDPDLIRQAIHNLIDNAIQYSAPSGKNKINIAINPAEDGNHLVISVKDTGIGIPPEARKRIFDKFFRAENAIKTKVNGTGLGLYIVKMIVENLDGKIWFESTIDAGTTFYVKIPINPNPRDENKK